MRSVSRRRSRRHRCGLFAQHVDVVYEENSLQFPCAAKTRSPISNWPINSTCRVAYDSEVPRVSVREVSNTDELVEVICMTRPLAASVVEESCGRYPANRVKRGPRESEVLENGASEE